MMPLHVKRLARMPWGNPNDCEQQRMPHEHMDDHDIVIGSIEGRGVVVAPAMQRTVIYAIVATIAGVRTTPLRPTPPMTSMASLRGQLSQSRVLLPAQPAPSACSMCFAVVTIICGASLITNDERRIIGTRQSFVVRRWSFVRRVTSRRSTTCMPPSAARVTWSAACG
jgi:hypothetical protein